MIMILIEGLNIFNKPVYIRGETKLFNTNNEEIIKKLEEGSSLLEMRTVHEWEEVYSLNNIRWFVIKKIDNEYRRMELDDMPDSINYHWYVDIWKRVYIRHRYHLIV